MRPEYNADLGSPPGSSHGFGEDAEKQVLQQLHDFNATVLNLQRVIVHLNARNEQLINQLRARGMRCLEIILQNRQRHDVASCVRRWRGNSLDDMRQAAWSVVRLLGLVLLEPPSRCVVCTSSSAVMGLDLSRNSSAAPGPHVLHPGEVICSKEVRRRAYLATAGLTGRLIVTAQSACIHNWRASCYGGGYGASMTVKARRSRDAVTRGMWLIRRPARKAKAIQRWCHSRTVAAVLRWRQVAQESQMEVRRSRVVRERLGMAAEQAQRGLISRLRTEIYVKRLLQGAAQRWSVLALMSSLALWRKASWGAVWQADRGRLAAHRLLHRRRTACWFRWRASVLVSRGPRRGWGRAGWWWKHRCLARSLDTWRGATAQRARMRRGLAAWRQAILVRCMALWRGQVFFVQVGGELMRLRRGYSAFRGHCLAIRGVRAAAERALESRRTRITGTLLPRAWMQWRQPAKRELSRRIMAVAPEAWRRDRTSCKAIRSWRDAAQEWSERRRQVLSGCNWFLDSDRKRVLRSWSTVVRERHYLIETVQRASKQWRVKVAAMAWRTWSEQAFEGVCFLDKAVHAVLRISLSAKRVAWLQWKQRARLRRRLLNKRRIASSGDMRVHMALKRMMLDLQKAWEAWIAKTHFLNGRRNPEVNFHRVDATLGLENRSAAIKALLGAVETHPDAEAILLHTTRLLSRDLSRPLATRGVTRKFPSAEENALMSLTRAKNGYARVCLMRGPSRSLVLHNWRYQVWLKGLESHITNTAVVAWRRRLCRIAIDILRLARSYVPIKVLKRITRRLVSRAWQRWKQSVSQLLLQKKLLADAVVALSSFSVALAYRKLRHNQIVIVRSAHAMRHMLQLTLATAANEWRLKASSALHVSRLVNKAIRRMILLQLTSATAHWRFESMSALRLLRVTKQLVRRIVKREMSGAWRGWVASCLVAKSIATLGRRASRSWRRGRLAKALRTWLVCIGPRGRVRDASRSWKQNGLAKALRTWQLWLGAIWRTRDNTMRALVAWLHASYAEGFRTWQIHASELLRAKTVVHQAILQWRGTHVASAVRRWIDIHAEGKREKDLVRISILRWQHVHVTRGLFKWLELLPSTTLKHASRRGEALLITSRMVRALGAMRREGRAMAKTRKMIQVWKYARLASSMRAWRNVVAAFAAEASRIWIGQVHSSMRADKTREALWHKWKSLYATELSSVAQARSLAEKMLDRAAARSLYHWRRCSREQSAELTVVQVARMDRLRRHFKFTTWRIQYIAAQAFQKDYNSFVVTRACLSFTRWRFKCRESKGLEQLCSTTATRLQERAMQLSSRTSLVIWRELVTEHKRLEDIIWHAMAKLVLMSEARALLAWREYREGRSAQLTVAERVARRLSLMALTRAFVHWNTDSKALLESYILTRRATAKLSRQAMARAYIYWRTTQHRGSRLVSTVNEFAKRVQNHVLALALTKWRYESSEGVRLERLRWNVMMRLSQYAVGIACKKWRVLCQEASRIDAATTRALAQMSMHIGAGVFQAWRRGAHRLKQLEKAAMRAAARLSRLAMAKALGTWHSDMTFYERLKWRMEQFRVPLARLFTRWRVSTHKRLSVSVSRSRVELFLCQEAHVTRGLKGCYHGWRSYYRSRPKPNDMRRAVQSWHKRALRRCLFFMRSRGIQASTRGKNVVSGVLLFQGATLRIGWELWRESWKQQATRTRRARASMWWGQWRTIAGHLAFWVAGSQQRRAFEHKGRSAIIRITQGILHKALHTWLQHARMYRRHIEEVSVALGLMGSNRLLAGYTQWQVEARARHARLDKQSEALGLWTHMHAQAAVVHWYVQARVRRRLQAELRHGVGLHLARLLHQWMDRWRSAARDLATCKKVIDIGLDWRERKDKQRILIRFRGWARDTASVVEAVHKMASLSCWHAVRHWQHTANRKANQRDKAWKIAATMRQRSIFLGYANWRDFCSRRSTALFHTKTVALFLSSSSGRTSELAKHFFATMRHCVQERQRLSQAIRALLYRGLATALQTWRQLFMAWREQERTLQKRLAHMFKLRQAQGMVSWRSFLGNQWARIDRERWNRITESLRYSRLDKVFETWRVYYLFHSEQERKMKVAMIKASRGMILRAFDRMRKQQTNGHMNEEAVKKARALWVADKFASCFMHWVESTITKMEDKKAFARAQRLFNRKHSVRHYFEEWLDRTGRESIDRYEQEKKMSATASLLKHKRLLRRLDKWRAVTKALRIMRRGRAAGEEIKSLQRDLQREKERTRELKLASLAPSQTATSPETDMEARLRKQEENARRVAALYDERHQEAKKKMFKIALSIQKRIVNRKKVKAMIMIKNAWKHEQIKAHERAANLLKMRLFVQHCQTHREKRFIATASRLFIWTWKARFDNYTWVSSSSAGQSAQHLASRLASVRLARDLQ